MTQNPGDSRPAMATKGQARQRKGSLARSVLLRLALRVALVIVIMTGISYWHVVNVVTEQNLANLSKFVRERTARESRQFTLAEANHAVLKQEVLTRLRGLGATDPRESFDSNFARFPDGTIRTRLEGFDGTKEAFAFFGRGVAPTADLRRRALVFRDLSNQFGPAWHHELQNVYFTMPENVLVGYWPEVPDWAHVLDAATELTAEEFMWAADLAHNPQRETVWTGLFYDAPSGTWMVSVETPVDVEGRHIATIGHDIPLNELIERTLKNHVEGGEGLIFRRDGRLIAHGPSIEEIKSHGGVYHIAQSGNARLQNIFALVAEHGQSFGVMANEGYDEYMAFSILDGPDWYMVELYPRSLVEGVALDTAKIVLLLGLLSLLLELLIFFVLVRKEIALPLRGLMAGVDAFAGGDGAVRFESERNDEIGELSRAFDHMAGAISQRTAALEDSEERFRATFEQAAVGIAHVGLDGQWLRVNARICEIVGYKEHELLGLTFQDITHPEDLDKDLAQLQGLLAGERATYTMEKRYIRKRGNLIWISLTVALVRDNAGAPAYFISVVEDIQARKASEQALEQLNASLEHQVDERTADLRQAQASLVRSEKMATLGQLAATVSHELRNPLSVVQNSAQLLLEIGTEHPDKAKRAVERIQRSAQRSAHIIEDMLEYARISLPDLRPVAFDAWVQRVIGEYAVPTAIRLETRLRAGEIAVMMDVERMQQAVINLLENACQSMLDLNRSGVESLLLIVSTRLEGGKAVLTIEDAGPGLSAGLAGGAVFEPLVSTKSFGVGLGLAIVKKIVESHGGSVSVENRKGAPGAEAVIALPLATD